MLLWGQTKIDSAQAAYYKATNDTEKVAALSALGQLYTYKSADSTIKYTTLAVALATKLKHLKSKAHALALLGVGYKVKGNYALALANYQAAIKIFSQLHDSAGIARVYNNIGNVNNIQKNYPEALRNYEAAVVIRRQLKDTGGLGSSIGNIGLMYYNQQNDSLALKYYLSAYNLLQNGRSPLVLAMVTDNIGDILAHKKDYKFAEKHFLDALKIRKATDEPGLVAASYNSLARLYYDMGKYTAAAKYGTMAYQLGMTAAGLKVIKESTSVLASSYEKLGDYKASKRYYEAYIEARDSMYNSESEKKIVAQQIQFEYEKKEVMAKAEQAKKDAITAEQIKYREAVIMASFIGLASLLIVTAFAIWAFRQKRKDNQIIQQLVHEQDKVIAARTSELANLNTSLAETNKKLIELIQYNAHQVREPLTRITGVMEIMDYITQEEFVQEVWPLVKEAVTDLDNNIRTVIKKAEEQPA